MEAAGFSKCYYNSFTLRTEVARRCASTRPDCVTPKKPALYIVTAVRTLRLTHGPRLVAPQQLTFSSNTAWERDTRWHAVTRGIVVVKALCYKPEGRGFETP
jgi:hypothetical protein